MPIFYCYYSSPVSVEIRIPSEPEKIVCTMRVSDFGIPYYDDLLTATFLLCDHFNLNLMNKIRQTAYEVYTSKSVYRSCTKT